MVMSDVSSEVSGQAVRGLFRFIRRNWQTSGQWWRDTMSSVWNGEAAEHGGLPSDFNLAEPAPYMLPVSTLPRTSLAAVLSRPVEHLPPMDRYPGLDYSTTRIDAGSSAFARQKSCVHVKGVYTVGRPGSLIVVATVRCAAIGYAASVRVAHWRSSTPEIQIHEFFTRLAFDREDHGRVELCLVEGQGGCDKTSEVIERAEAAGMSVAHHACSLPVFSIAADPHGNTFRGDSPALQEMVSM
jgi:hypothetical protein